MRIVCSIGGGRTAAAVLVMVAGLAFGAARAQAQDACLDPSDVPEGVYGEFYDSVGDDFFGLDDEKLCDKITKTLVDACHKAVDAAAKCYEQLFKSILKSYKTACASEGSGKGDCIDYFKDQNEGIQGEIDFARNQGHGYCDDYAEEAWNFCMNDFP